MKFIKYAVGLVIALSVIPMVVVAVAKLDDPRLKTIEFEVIDIDESTITFSENTYNNIHTLAILDDINVINSITTKLNGIELTDYSFTYFAGYHFIDNLDDSRYWEELTELNQAVISGYTPTIGDKWTMTFEVPNPTPPLVKLLVGFAPLLFVGGVLLFMLNKRKLD